MATKVAMPKLGLVMTEGVVVKWLKDDGQPVRKGEPIAVIMSKKITYQVEAPADGVLRQVARSRKRNPSARRLLSSRPRARLSRRCLKLLQRRQRPYLACRLLRLSPQGHPPRPLLSWLLPPHAGWRRSWASNWLR